MDDREALDGGEAEALGGDLLTTKAAAGLLGRSPEYVRRAIEAERLVAIEDPTSKRKRLLVTRESVTALRDLTARPPTADGTLTTADLDAAVLRRTLEQDEQARLVDDYESEIGLLEAEVARLTARVRDLEGEVRGLVRENERAVSALERLARSRRRRDARGGLD